MGGLVNSLTRAQLIDAIGAVGQRETIMLMTDCIYHTRNPSPLPAGDGLGQFGRAERLDDLWIVKPGVSWQTKDLAGAKSLGIPSSVIAKTHGKFERAWDNWLKRGMPGDGPAIPVEFDTFVGLKTAALAYRNLKRAGRWKTVQPKYGFGWRTKHDPARFERHGDEVWLWPQQGNIMMESRPYRAALDEDGDRDVNGMDAMPDYVRITER
jgi:hypothetical protein